MLIRNLFNFILLLSTYYTKFYLMSHFQLNKKNFITITIIIITFYSFFINFFFSLHIILLIKYQYYHQHFNQALISTLLYLH